MRLSFLSLNGLDGGSSDLDAWREFTEGLEIRTLLAVVESSKWLRRNLKQTQSWNT